MKLKYESIINLFYIRVKDTNINYKNKKLKKKNNNIIFT